MMSYACRPQSLKSPSTYRRDHWENMRDGYREIATFWHMTEAAGSPFDSNDFTTPGRYDDYASLYVDFANDSALLSRRQLAGVVKKTLCVEYFCVD